jgi:hypothetical protein
LLQVRVFGDNINVDTMIRTIGERA